MMSDIPSEYAGVIQTWLHCTTSRKPLEYTAFRMRRKDGYFQFRYGEVLAASYDCSWLEAQRRFKMLLITKRILGI